MQLSNYCNCKEKADVSFWYASWLLGHIQGASIRITAYLSETMEGRRPWDDIECAGKKSTKDFILCEMIL